MQSALPALPALAAPHHAGAGFAGIVPIGVVSMYAPHPSPPVNAMRPISTLTLLACLALLACAGNAAGKEVRRMAPEASATNDDANTQADHDGDIDSAVVTPHAPQRTQPRASATVAPTTSSRTTSDGRTLPSRFHSFLPGMFR